MERGELLRSLPVFALSGATDRKNARGTSPDPRRKSIGGLADERLRAMSEGRLEGRTETGAQSPDVEDTWCRRRCSQESSFSLGVDPFGGIPSALCQAASIGAGGTISRA